MKKSGFQKFLAKLGVERVDDNDPFFVSDMPENFDNFSDDFSMEHEQTQSDGFDAAPRAGRDAQSAVLNIRRVEPGEEAPQTPKRAPFKRSLFRAAQSGDTRPVALIAPHKGENLHPNDEIDDLMDDLLGENDAETDAAPATDETKESGMQTCLERDEAIADPLDASDDAAALDKDAAARQTYAEEAYDGESYNDEAYDEEAYGDEQAYEQEAYGDEAYGEYDEYGEYEEEAYAEESYEREPYAEPYERDAYAQTSFDAVPSQTREQDGLMDAEPKQEEVFLDGDGADDAEDSGPAFSDNGGADASSAPRQETVFHKPQSGDGGVREAFVRPHNHGVVVVLGMFDGVHAGHQHMLAMARRDADQLGLPLHVVTFYEHPASILTGAPVPYLSTLEDRIGLLTQHGMDCFNVYHFTPQFASMHYRDFIQMLVRELDMTHMVIGQDAVFGRGGQGNAQTLMRESGELGISVHVVPSVTANGEKVSSSAIRAAAARGDMPFANACLTRPYSVVGTVSRGAQRGALLGFPTANLLPTPGMLVPANGVYVSRISLQEGDMMPAVTNIGVHPTVDRLTLPVIETHILDYEGDCYDQHARVEILQMLRPEVKFATFAELSGQIAQDTQNAKAYFAAAAQQKP